MFKLSIIICTYNRGYILPECLDALNNQTIDSSEFELIIIDNNSTDNTKEVAKKFHAKFKDYKYVLEENIGLSHARNRGFNEADADWIFYLDDDAKVHEDCIAQVIKTIKSYDFDCFGGAYYPWYKYGKPKWYKDEWGTNTWNKPNKISLLKDGYITGGIMAVKKNILLEIGGYNTEIGMRGNIIGYGEETLLLKKIRDIGYKIGYNPNIKMDHLVAKYKLSPFWFIKSAYSHGRDSWIIFNKKIPRDYKYLLSFVWRNKYILKLFISKFFKLLEHEYYWQNFVIDIFREVAADFGKYIGARRYYYNKSEIDKTV